MPKNAKEKNAKDGSKMEKTIKKCKKCNVPLEGFVYKISKFLFGIRPSTKKEGVCNKCEKEK